MIYLRSLIHSIFLFISVIPYSSLIIIFMLLRVSREIRWKVASAWLKLGADSANWFCGVKYKIHNLEILENLKNEEKLILLCKHQSGYETFLIPGIVPHNLALVFKKELLWIPFFGWSLASLDMIFINRKQGTTSFKKLMKEGKRLLNRNNWILMFPEGTRTERGKVGDYKTGAAKLAIDNQVSVVPIAITSAKCWAKGSWLKYPGTVDVIIGEPIDSKNKTREQLITEVKTWIEAKMQEFDPQPLLEIKNERKND